MEKLPKVLRPRHNEMKLLLGIFIGGPSTQGDQSSSRGIIMERRDVGGKSSTWS